MKIALAQLNPTVGDFAGNSAKILEFAQRAAQRGADLAVFSELCLCGYLPMDLIERPQFIDRNERELACLAKKLPIPSIVGYAARATGSTGKSAANAAALLANGKIEFVQHKMLLPTYDVFDESRYFQPAAAQNVFSFGGQNLGITVCEDIWNDKTFWAKPLYERDPVAELIAKRASLIINISGSPYTIDKRALRLDMLRALAKSHGRPLSTSIRSAEMTVWSSTETASLSCPTAESPPRRAPLWKTSSCLTQRQTRETFTRSPRPSSILSSKRSFAERATTFASPVSALW